MSLHKEKIIVTLIIATYNWPRVLQLVLESVLRQTYLPNEIIIADDGSKHNTRDIILSFQKTCKIPIIHVWHEDKGFRLSKIRNKAIFKSTSDYIIQIDGDTIINRNFIKDHLKSSRKNSFITASRVLLNQEITSDFLNNGFKKITPFSLGITNRLNALHFPFINKFIKHRNMPIDKLIYKVRGCNMSFWKKDFLEINGYNENITGWGIEDSELTLRLLKKGLFLKKIKLSAIQYHLYHPEASRDHFYKNQLVLNENLFNEGFKTLNGIEKI